MALTASGNVLLHQGVEMLPAASPAADGGRAGHVRRACCRRTGQEAGGRSQWQGPSPAWRGQEGLWRKLWAGLFDLEEQLWELRAGSPVSRAVVGDRARPGGINYGSGAGRS